MPAILIRDVATDETRVVLVPEGTSFPADPSFRWAGFWRTKRAALKALACKEQCVREQLYGEPRGMNGTPGPESVSELFRL